LIFAALQNAIVFPGTQMELRNLFSKSAHHLPVNFFPSSPSASAADSDEDQQIFAESSATLLIRQTAAGISVS